MKLATISDGSPDGRLHLVSRDLQRMTPAAASHVLQEALEDWDTVAPELAAEFDALQTGGGGTFTPGRALAPLPRAWQWLDGSAYPTHARLMQRAFDLPPIDTAGRPLMYQGMSNRFLSASEDVPFPSEEDGIDFEGEFGVITDVVPMATPAERAVKHIRLIVQINDWSLRTLAPIEMKTGFGWIQAKPACSAAPVAVTPDELGSKWRDCQVDLPLEVDWNGKAFGRANGYGMRHGFDELIAHAARTRDLVAGTIIGSGTVSNSDYPVVGSSCISERRTIEMIDSGGVPTTGYMNFGDHVRMSCQLPDGTSVFGEMSQRVVRAASA